MKSIYILATVFLLNSAFAKAQIIEDVGGVKYTFYQEGEVKNDSDLNNRSFTFSTIDAWVPFPQFKIGSTTVYSNLSYRYLGIDYENQQALSVNRPDNLQEFKSTLLINYPFNEKWSLLGIVIPSLASDFKSQLSEDDFLLQGGFAVLKKIKSQSKIEVGVGLFATYVFGEFTLLPSLVFDYKSANNKWLAQGYWPKFTVLRNLKNDWQVGLALSIEGTQYNIQNFMDANQTEVDYAEYSIIQSGLQLNKKIYKSIWLQVQSGYAFNNKYLLFDKNATEIENGDYSLDNLFYGKILVTYRM